MGILLDRLKVKKVLISDCAWGTMVQEMGLKPGQCPEEWNLSRAEQVESIPAANVRAGADLVLTNTFGGSRLVLKKKGMEDQVAAFNAAGAGISLRAARETGTIVAASIGPTGEFLAPLGVLNEKEMEAVFREQISSIVDAGVRVICVETMTAVEEAACAVRAALSAAQDQEIDIIATMTFDPTPNGYRTVMGVECRQAVEVLSEAGADILGSNCGNGIEQMVPIAAEFSRLTDKPILIQANAGLPVILDGKVVYRETPEVMAAWIKDLVDAGARIIGGCCGTRPEHISAIREAVDRL